MDRSNLIVNYLPSGYTEDDLRALFSPFGNILSIKIVRDKITGISMGFGFVNYASNDCAVSAVNSLNGLQLRDGKIMKVSVARPAWKANIHSNLYLSGFPSSFQESDVLDFLGFHASKVENIRLLRDTNRNPRGAAVVRMCSEESVNSVILALNGSSYQNHIIAVKPWRPEFRPDRVSDSSILRNDSDCTTVDHSPSSETSSAGAYWPSNWKEYTSVAEDLLNQMLKPNEKSKDEAVLFVYHLPEVFDDTQLLTMFEKYGEVESVKFIKKKCYGFVSFNKSLNAKIAMNELNNYSLNDKNIKIELKL